MQKRILFYMLFLPAFLFTIGIENSWALGDTEGFGLHNGVQDGAGDTANSAGEVILMYKANSKQRYRQLSSTVDDTLIGVHGDTITDLTNASDTIGPGDTTRYAIIIHNSGNNSDTFVPSNSWLDGADSWTIFYYLQATGGAAITVTGLLSEDAETTIYAEIWVSDTALDGDTSRNQITVSVGAGTVTNSGYTGDNLTAYAGNGNDSTVVITFVTAAAVYLAKTSSVATPATYVARTAGATATDVVPGATITYTLTYDNDGSNTSTNMVIIDYLPANTTFDTAESQLDSPDSNNTVASITYEVHLASSGSFVAMTNSHSDSTDVDAVRWTIGNAVSPQSYGTNADATGTADAASVPDFDAGTLQFKVTVN